MKFRPSLHAGSAEFLDQLLTRATATGGSGADVAQALDVPIALLERRSQLEAAHQHFQSDACPGPTGGCRPRLGRTCPTLHPAAFQRS